jgi:hypothetical protein
MKEAGMNTGCKAVAEALHAACVALDRTRTERMTTKSDPARTDGAWVDKVGAHVALALAAIPDSVLRAWLLDEKVIGGAEVYNTLRRGAASLAKDNLNG